MSPIRDSLDALVALIQSGTETGDRSARDLLNEMLRARFSRINEKVVQIRDALGLARSDGVAYAGLIAPDNPTSGQYGGTSLVWFPTESESLISFVVGTRGLAPDEGILTRPGHRRRVAALRRYLAGRGVDVWSKPDPATLGVVVPKIVTKRFAEWNAAFDRYGTEMYLIARVPRDEALARVTVQAFTDLYGYERGWVPLKAAEGEFNGLLAELRGELFQHPTADGIARLVRERRFVVLQGPPGTGKTKLAEEVRRTAFADRGMTIQFHPSVTYEDFVIGLSPATDGEDLRFTVRPGSLLAASVGAKDSEYLLVIDEINRADLSKVLGEAIYLFETGEIGGAHARTIRLPQPFAGTSEFKFPPHLYVLATMNTADRSIASMDLAIRRRFAFVDVPPDRRVLQNQGSELALSTFDRLTEVFVEHAPDDGLNLLPGHAYFLGRDDHVIRRRFRYDLLPLLDDYLRQGILGGATAELYAVRDEIDADLNRAAG